MAMTKHCLLLLTVAGLSCAQSAQSAVPRLPYNYDLNDRMHYCQWNSVQAAWGAQARFKGAPAAFR